MSGSRLDEGRKMDVAGNRSVLFICERYYLRFYQALAERLSAAGFAPIWVAVDGPGEWQHGRIDASPLIDGLAARTNSTAGASLEDVCIFERAVFERPDVFRNSYPYTVNVVRSYERAPHVAWIWYQVTLALLRRFTPAAVFVWNGRYLPYSAISAAAEAAGQLLLTSEIGWIPGTIFIDEGQLSSNTTDLAGRSWNSVVADDARAQAFLREYMSAKATMVSQRLHQPEEVRRRLLGPDGTLLVLFGCQVDWDTNVVIGARRFRSNEAAVSFLMECTAAIPGARLVVKTHPLDANKREDSLQDLLGSRGVVVSDIHPHTLIEAADCVAVRNSTLGFEALSYGKSVLVLEDAKYSEAGLTFGTDAVESQLARIATGDCHLPDLALLKRFILHLLDRYLVPVGYEYFFDPAKLGLLSHFARNDSYRVLEQMLLRSAGARTFEVDQHVMRAVDACPVGGSSQASFLGRQVSRFSAWMARKAGA
jgi:hypothetical protein